ncbi:MAG: ribonuclease HII [Proteobacteria bacterium]|nr:ribonuclease HII [Pseudomonadota bacterium]
MIPTDRPTYLFESLSPTPVAGVDEVGRGPMAGPVVAAAVILRPSTIPAGLADSKTLPFRVRQELYEALCQGSDIGVGAASVDEIDRINILQATLVAMRRAVAKLSQQPRFVLVDGNQMPSLPCPARTVVKGDGRCLSIAAASIVAKVVRDRLMARLAERYPLYGWDHNVGYCTSEHRSALRRHGATIHHRRSFSPVRQALGDLTRKISGQINMSL